MSDTQIQEILVKLPPWLQMILMILGTLVVVSTAYIKATPSEDDDKWYAKVEGIPLIGPVLGVFVRFSVVTRKEKVTEKDKDL